MMEEGRFIVDIRVFMLSMTVAMCASFFAGITMGPSSWEQVPTTTTNPLGSPPPPLDLSKHVIEMSMEHPPAGQHLLVDIANVEAAFLDSEERLTDAMVRTVKETGLTMLSSHCHKLFPAGISCVGVLMESHISFHTWPDEGVITLDLFTCGPYPLLPNAVETMERLFGIPRSENEKIRAKWSHELRGFRPEDEKTKNAVNGYSELSQTIFSPLDVYYKKQIYSNLTKFHRVDVWDVLDLDDSPTYEDGIKHGLKDGDPRWETPELATPVRALFQNGHLILQDQDWERRESLVHPGMFAHPNPARIAIVGGREGGSLREVLKHNTVESVTVVEEDEELVKICRQLFPKMSNCSNFEGRADDCFEDELVSVRNEDPRAYFKTNYGSRATTDAPLLDFVVVDHEDPIHVPELFTDEAFINSLVNSLSPEGVLTFAAGIAPDIDDPPADKGIYAVRDQLMRLLESNPDVKAVLVYEEPETGFGDPSVMLMVCKSENCRSRWYARSDQIDFAIYERIVKTKSQEQALVYYDGTTQFSYSIPPKAWETNYCLRTPTPFECNYLHLDQSKELFDLDADDESKSAFRLESNTKTVDGKEVAETHVFAKVDIPKGSYIMPKHLARSLVITQRNIDSLNGNLNVGGGPVSVIEDLMKFIGEHGHPSNVDGTDAHFVEIGGSVLIQAVDNEEEANVGRWVPPHPSGRTPTYSPVYERHRMSYDVFIVATEDIPAGTELKRWKGMWKKN